MTEYRLDNGVRVLLYPEASRPTVTVNLTVFVGSRHEGYGETGMAHLLEHMVFKGTPTFPDMPKALRNHGANYNGTTNVTAPIISRPCRPPTITWNSPFAWSPIVSSTASSSREHLVSEMTVVRNEFERGENSPQGILISA